MDLNNTLNMTQSLKESTVWFNYRLTAWFKVGFKLNKILVKNGDGPTI